MADRLDRLPAAALSRLLTWLSPSFPVGAYSYSHGLEWAIEDGSVRSANDLLVWIGALLRHGAGWSDGVLIAQAHRSAMADKLVELASVAELALALQPSRERHLEATAQGAAFLATVRAAWPAERLGRLAEAAAPNGIIAYPVALAIASAAHFIPLPPTIAAYLHAYSANLVSAGIRLVPLGQTDGQRILAALAPLIETTATETLDAPLSEIGGMTFRADIASMKHETQYTRLFRS